jgi:predicted ATP-dependent endonuclease of OLD family
LTRVDSISVSGLAGRKQDLEIKLDAKVNVFFGLNGKGKTSLLKIIHAALRNDHRGITRVPFKKASVAFFSSDHDKHFVRSISKQDPLDVTEGLFAIETEDGEFVEVRGASTIESSAPTWTTRPRSAASVFRHSFLGTSRLIPERIDRQLDASRRSVQRDEEVLDEFFQRSLQRLWQQYANTILSQVRELQDEGIAGILESIFFVSSTPSKTRTPTRAAYKYVSDFLKRQGSSSTAASRTLEKFKTRYEDDPQLQRVVGDIEKLEQGLRSLEEPRQRLEQLVNEFFFGAKQIRFADRGIFAHAGTDELEIANFSSGEKQLLRILVECIRCGKDTIIIDEPELSMHIDWQRRLLGTMHLINPDCQIIVATHSPEIMAKVDDDKIFRI